jgi:hypothetical protein
MTSWSLAFVSTRPDRVSTATRAGLTGPPRRRPLRPSLLPTTVSGRPSPSRSASNTFPTGTPRSKLHVVLPSASTPRTPVPPATTRTVAARRSHEYPTAVPAPRSTSAAAAARMRRRTQIP